VPSEPPDSSTGSTRLRAGALLLGIGLGGLADGIVFHQVLQWHHLVANPVPPDTLEALRTNVFWDGVFHVLTTLTLTAGLVLLRGSWRRHERGPVGARPVLGWAAIGWGAFNVADQIVLHELLDLHDIRMGVPNPGVYNWSYGASGLVLVALGVWLLRRRAGGEERDDPARAGVTSR
jgi:uncharacterized membrane protein